jgi:dTDP-L-rhamnose 4-epimerase
MCNRILITGGAGFIGSSIAIALTKRNYEVRVLDSLTPQIHGPNGDSPTRRAVDRVAELIHADVRDMDAVASALKGVHAVIHLAAETGTGQSMYEVGRYADVNIMGTSKLLNLLSTGSDVERVIVASSRAVYGEGKYVCDNDGSVYPHQRHQSDMESGYFDPRCPRCNGAIHVVATDEDSQLHPTSVYGITKQVQEQLVLLCSATIGIPAIALRYQNVYGPGQSLANPYTGILSIFSTRLKSGGDINIFEDGKESRDFVYIDDVVAATIAALEALPNVTGAFNVGSGHPVNVLSVVAMLQEQLGVGGEIRVTGHYRSGDIRHNFADIQRARDLLGWEPAVKFEDGLRRFVIWVESQQVGVDGYERALDELRSRGMLK